MTRTHWIAGGGHFVGPICRTDSHSVGIFHHAAVLWMIQIYRQAWRYDYLLTIPQDRLLTAEQSSIIVIIGPEFSLVPHRLFASTNHSLLEFLLCRFSRWGVLNKLDTIRAEGIRALPQ